MRIERHIMPVSDFKLGDFYTPEELVYCSNRILSLAGRFSAKVAIRKVLQQEIPWKEINVTASKTGQPVVSFPGISVSIAHDADLVAAFAGKGVQVGLDITSIKRIEELLGKKHADQVLTRVLSRQEQEDCQKNTPKLAMKWAGKEAVSKLLGTGFWQGIFFQEIEILHKNGKHTIKLTGNALKLAKEKNLKNWKISFEQTPEAVFAFVVAAY